MLGCHHMPSGLSRSKHFQEQWLGPERRIKLMHPTSVQGVEDMSSLSEWTAMQFDPTLNWDDVEWIKKRWGGKLVLKGILDVEDAKNAAQEGVDGIVVSNHGGRQLDGASGSISVLPYIADAVGDRLEVLFDGGVRSGHDVFKALANGARGCLIGRAYLYGLAAMGEAGVAAALEVIRESFDNAMILTGTTAVNQITRDKLHRVPLTN